MNNLPMKINNSLLMKLQQFFKRIFKYKNFKKTPDENTYTTKLEKNFIDKISVKVDDVNIKNRIIKIQLWFTNINNISKRSITIK